MRRERLAFYDSQDGAPDGAAEGREGGLASSPAQRVSVRYSQFVGAMKVFLPAIAVTLIALVVAWPHLQPGKERFRLGLAAVAPGDVENPRMVNPRFTGTHGLRPFSVTAKTATQLGPDLGLIELERPQADLTLADGSWVALSSLAGTYNQETQDLELRNQVNLFHDAGYEFHTASAHIDLRNGIAYGDSPVTGQGPAGHLTSEGFRVLDRGKTTLFTGRARLVVYPGASGVER